MSPLHNHLLRQIDRERSTLERYGNRTARTLAFTAVRHGLSAARTGHDPAEAVIDVLAGNPRLGLGGMAPALVELLLAAHLTGLRRAELLSRLPGLHPIGQPSRLADGSTSPVMLSRSKTRDRIEDLLLLLALSYEDYRTLYGGYLAQAQAQVTRLTGYVRQALTVAIHRPQVATGGSGGGPDIPPSTSPFRQYEPGRYGRLGAIVSRAMQAVGVSSSNPYLLTTLTTTAANQGHGEGWWNGLANPKLASKLTAFSHSSVLDDATTEICIPRDEITLPPDDPYWQTNYPTLHYGCRSIILPWFAPVDFTGVPAGLPPPQPGFGRAPSGAWGFRFGQAA